jgi:hypothetical protein
MRRRLPRFLLYSRRYLATPKGRWLLNQYLKWYLRREMREMLWWRMLELTLREASKEVEGESGKRESRGSDFEEDSFPWQIQ